MASSAADPAAAEAAPELLSRGAYSLYKAPDGGMHLAYRAEGMDEDGHLVVPAAMVKMAQMAAEGKGPLRMLGRILPGGG